MSFSVSAESELAQAVIDAYRQSNASWVEMQAIKSALRHGPAFVFTTKGDVELGEPQVVVSVCAAAHATALIDWRTRRVEAALESLGGQLWNVYLPGQLTLQGNGPNQIGSITVRYLPQGMSISAQTCSSNARESSLPSCATGAGRSARRALAALGR